jgi:hypothetical protein
MIGNDQLLKKSCPKTALFYKITYAFESTYFDRILTITLPKK